MTIFAQGTNPEYANAYSNWWFGGAVGPAPQRSAFGPDAPSGNHGGQQRAGRPNAGGNAYQPGRAQPQQQPSRGAPYSAYAPQQPARPSGVLAHDHPANPRGPNYDPNAPMPSDTPGQGNWSDSPGNYAASGGGPRRGGEGGGESGGEGGSRAVYPRPPRPFYMQNPGGGLGNFAYAPPDQRPQPFTQSTNFMGQRMEPGQFYAQRDAFINNINQNRQSFAMNPSAGRPQMDFGSMWSQAGDMVQGGWQNPLAGLMGQQPQGRVHAGYQGQRPPPLPGSGWWA